MKPSRRRSRARRDRDPGSPEQVLYLPGEAHAGAVLRVEGSEADHAARSLRLRPGDPVALANGAGSRYHCTIRDLGKHSLEVVVDRVEAVAVWPRREFWLGAGVLRSTRMDTLVEKISELGVRRFFPLDLKHCVAKPHEAGAKLDRWQRLAIESLKQCKRAMLLDVEEPRGLEDFLAGLPEEASLWVADPSGDSPRILAAAAEAPGPVVLLVGPEGGLSEEETGILGRRGARFVGLGGHRLRAETAGITLVTVALAAMGEMDAGLRDS